MQPRFNFTLVGALLTLACNRSDPGMTATVTATSVAPPANSALATPGTSDDADGGHRMMMPGMPMEGHTHDGGTMPPGHDMGRHP